MYIPFHFTCAGHITAEDVNIVGVHEVVDRSDMVERTQMAVTSVNVTTGS